jgi:hypothetical protein
MSLLTQIMLEAERASAAEFSLALSRDAGLRAILREEGLRAAMQAAARQADSRREPIRQTPAPAGHPDPRSVGTRSSRPDPVGTPITNNSSGQPEVRVVGRARPTKPMQSGKSRIVPEPDQIQSPPLGRRSSPLEPPGY